MVAPDYGVCVCLVCPTPAPGGAPRQAGPDTCVLVPYVCPAPHTGGSPTLVQFCIKCGDCYQPVDECKGRSVGWKSYTQALQPGACVDGQIFFEGVNEQVRWGAFLRAIPPPRRVGDYAHATARLCIATQKRLQQDVSSWV